MMGRTPGTTKEVTEARLDRIEDHLLAGIPSGQVDRKIAQEYGISVRQAQRLRAKLHKRWDQESLVDAPHRREKLIRMAERHYALAMAGEPSDRSDKKKKRPWTAATTTLRLLAEMSGALAQHDPVREARWAELGLPPSDPTQMLVWAQRVMALALSEVMTTPAIEPERRIRMIADLGAKLGMTHAKALVQARLAEVAERVYGNLEPPQDALVSITDAEWHDADAEGAGAGDDAGDAPARHGSDAPSPKDE